MAGGSVTGFRSLMTRDELLSRDDIPQDVRDALLRLLSEPEPAAERALRASEERYRRITEAITDYTYTVRVERGRAVETHHGPACEAVTGYRSEDYASDPSLWYRMVYSEDRALVEDQARRALAAEDAPAIEHRLVRKDGAIRWVRNTIVPFRDGEGRLLAYDGVVTDVTERRDAEEALRERERELVTLVENAHDPIVRLDRDLRYVYCNAVVGRLLGMPAASLVGRKAQGLTTPPADPGPVNEALQHAIEAGEEREIEHSLELPGGARSFLTRIVPERDNAGRVESLLVIARDITERKRAELRAEMLKHSIDVHFDGAYWFDTDNRFVYVNSVGCQMLGYSQEQMLRLTVHDVNPKAAPERMRATWAELRQKGYFCAESVHRRSDGSEFPVEISTSYVRFGDREYACGFARDITARKRAEQTLRESEEKFSKAFRAAPVSMSIMALGDGTFLDVNDEGLRISGFSREEVVGSRVGETGWITTSDRRRLIHILRQEGRVAGLDVPFRTKSGREILGLVRGEKIVVDGRECLLAAMVDVTERRRAEEERLALERQVQHAQKLESLGVLAGGIAHDFNNLLVAILGNASLAAGSLPPGAALLAPFRDIEAAARRASELCSQLLAYSGRGTFVVEPVDLNRLIEEMVSLIRVSISKKAELRLEPAARLLAIEADATQLRQIILNLVVNASEAIGETGGTITVSTGTADAEECATLRDGQGLPPGPCAWLDVADTGAGMDAETQRRLFDPFFTTKFAGRGLGLSAVLGIVRGHHGAIRVASEPGRGTAFRVFFPLLDDVSNLARPERPAAEAGCWQREGTALVVDDDASVRTVARSMVERHGFSVLLAADGHEAIQVFREHASEIALVLLDLTMPRLGGGETLREIRTLRADVPVVLMSGYGESEAAELIAGQQVQAFLQKPFDTRRLGETLQAALGTCAAASVRSPGQAIRVD
jgi:two-component system, cell cycle sensor histidine kinase and response regulator CckA